jgi:putative glutamine amidotransferase
MKTPNTPPLILISASTDRSGVEFKDASLSLSLNYPRAIQAAGGVPCLLPCLAEPDFIAQAVRQCQGVLLAGGDDIQPSLYTEGPLAPALQQTVETSAPERDLFELLLLDEIFRQRKPLLGICRGHQILNVALGGTLVVDIPSQVPGALNHNRMDLKDQPVHEIAIAAGSELACAVGNTALTVNSSHHQAVEKIAKPLRANAVSTDGMVEGLELAPDARHFLPFLLTVQFHPERLFARYERHAALFKTFTEACRRQGHRHV